MEMTELFLEAKRQAFEELKQEHNVSEEYLEHIYKQVQRNKATTQEMVHV